MRSHQRDSQNQTSNSASFSNQRLRQCQTLETTDMVDLSTLAPSEMGRLLGKPDGEAGRAVSEMLNRVNADITQVVYRSLHLQPRERVLEIGFANGRLLPALLSCADELSYVGVDISETMVAEATVFNADLIAEGRASFHLASAEALPFADQSFDKALAVNVIYFWKDPIRPLAEIRRVLRPGGLSCIASVISKPGEPSPPFARPEFGFYWRDRDTLLELHHDAGFRRIKVNEDYREAVTMPDGSSRQRSYAIIMARP
jgi:SAM-dependent methyltransferase